MLDPQRSFYFSSCRIGLECQFVTCRSVDHASARVATVVDVFNNI